MSDEVRNGTTSNESEFHESIVDQGDLCSNRKPHEQSDNDINGENNDQSQNNIAIHNDQEKVLSSKTGGQISEREQKLRTELLKIQADCDASLEREKELATKLQKIDFQTVKVAELEVLNEELREQLNESLKECGSLKQDLKKYV